MGLVFAGRDIALDRRVAIKVLRPELATEVGAARFLREGRVLALLSHPNIVPIHRAGEADGLLYFVMDFIDGPTLATRLDQGPLPLLDVVRIGVDLLGALEVAHRRSVVHRDLKPSNIFLLRDRSFLADFGVARTAFTRETTLTESGHALGTLAYMAPEQLAGGTATPQSDFYSLGKTLYEAATGQRLGIPPDPSAIDWKGLPESTRAVLERALAWNPDERWATAAEFRTALELSVPGEEPTTVSAPAAQQTSPARRAWLGAALAGLMVALSLAAAWLWRRPVTVDLRPNDQVAIFPFRTPPSDSSLGYLQDGMVDLLAAKVSVAEGPRVVDPARTIREWNTLRVTSGGEPPESALAPLAAKLGASRFVSGTMTRGAQQLIVTVRLQATRDQDSYRGGSAQGPVDSLDAIVGRLTAQLLSLSADEAQDRLPALTSAALPALQDYLRGKAAYRKGRFGEAADFFVSALRRDSTFAIAAVSCLLAASKFGHPGGNLGYRLAWAGRDRLPSTDRLVLNAFMRWSYPVPGDYADELEAWEQAVRAAPDRAEMWSELGDRQYRFGPLAGRTDAWVSARKVLTQAVTLDPGYGPALLRLVEVSGSLRDSEAVRSFGPRYLAVDSAGQLSDYIRWQIARVTSGAVWEPRLIQPGIQGHNTSLTAVVWAAQLDGRHVEDADTAMQVLLNGSVTADDRIEQLTTAHDLAMNRGRPLEGLRYLMDISKKSGANLDRYLVLDALYWGGDTVAAKGAVARMAASTDGPLAVDAVDRAVQIAPTCLVALWRLDHGDTTTAARAIERLKAITPARDSSYAVRSAINCSMLLRAVISVGAKAPNARQHVMTLDSLVRGGRGFLVFALEANLTLVKLFRQLRRPDPALLASRRRWHWGRVLYLSTFIREEAGVAALVGDTAGAIRAWNHYLALRSKPEASGLKSRSDAQTALAALGQPRR